MADLHFLCGQRDILSLLNFVFRLARNRGLHGIDPIRALEGRFESCAVIQVRGNKLSAQGSNRLGFLTLRLPRHTLDRPTVSDQMPDNLSSLPACRSNYNDCLSIFRYHGLSTFLHAFQTVNAACPTNVCRDWNLSAYAVGGKKFA